VREYVGECRRIVGLQEDGVVLGRTIAYGQVLEQVSSALGMEWTSLDGGKLHSFASSNVL